MSDLWYSILLFFFWLLLWAYRRIFLFLFQIFYSLQENSAVPEACLWILCVGVPASVSGIILANELYIRNPLDRHQGLLIWKVIMIPDKGSDDIRYQGEPAQADGGDQESV